jgi:hypothetical protein
MRWSAGLFAVLLGLILVTGSGCRELSTENADRNRAPETYLSAAPVDSIAGGGLTRIAHRYRAHWSGADVDGEVVGFFVAVTETTLDAQGRPYRLPAPRPSQYRFTTAHDSLFVFNILEGRGSDRQHALYVYAVDNQGRVDATPAVSHFVARDQTLPSVRFLLAEGRGTVFDLAPGGNGVIPGPFTRLLRDSLELPIHAPIDTIPFGGSVRFEWQGVDPDFGSSISGYVYKLTEIEFVRVDSSVTSVEYGHGVGPTGGPLPVGSNTFRIRAIDEAGGSTQPDAVRIFYVNLSPDTWFAGPDPVLLAPHLLSDSLGLYFPMDPLTRWPADFPGNPFGADTLQTLPAQRVAMDGLDVPREVGGPPIYRPKTFLEGRTRFDREFRWYIRTGADDRNQYGDTIAIGSSIVARLGGLDRDSPYVVLNTDTNSPYPVLRSGPQNGSPSTFQTRLDIEGASGSGQTGTYGVAFPNFKVDDTYVNEQILYRETVNMGGMYYLGARAVDGNLTADLRVRNPVTDSQSPTTLRSKVLTFPVNFNPGLIMVDPLPGALVNPPVGTDRMTVSIRVTDPDPDPINPRPTGTNSPYATMYFAIRARVYQVGAEPADNEGWQDPVLGYHLADTTTPGAFPYTAPIVLQLDVPPTMPPGPAILEIEVVDNIIRTNARTIRVPIPFNWRVGP